jgi:hypothetical protein
LHCNDNNTMPHPIPDFTINNVMEMTAGREKLISFISIANPPAQARPCAQCKNREIPKFYDPSSRAKKAFKAAVKAALIDDGITQFPVFDNAGLAVSKGVGLFANFHMKRIQADYRVVNGRRELVENPQPYPSCKDLDNMEKFACDALEGVLYENDNCVCVHMTEKTFVSDNIPENSVYHTGWTEFKFVYLFG